MNFETQVPGKWILAGEHAVLRGCPALVFPLHARSLIFNYTENAKKKNELSLDLAGEHGEELQLLFWGVVEKACELKKVRRSEISGQVSMHSTLPVGAGLGASAALSVAVARWFQYLKIIQVSELQEFARLLENLFHGESSGVDVAVALSGKGLRYVRGQAISEFTPRWRPKFYVSYSGKRGITADCVTKVKQLHLRESDRATKIDARMLEAEMMCENALLQEESKGLSSLKQAIDLAHSCFLDWDLLDLQSQNHVQWLRGQGAIAVKPTGSGNGGYILSLWDRELSNDLKKKLIAGLSES